MIYNKHLHVSRIKEVAIKLDYLLKDVVFVGGSVVALYADDPAADEVRPTDDIDIVVGISVGVAFSAFEEKIRKLGFLNVIDAQFMYRYKINEIIVDLMPIDEGALGFPIECYKEGIEKSFSFEIDGISIRLMPFHYFIASKMAAHHNRNKGDLRQSKDFQDIVYSFDNRLDPLKDMEKANTEVAIYLKQKMDDFLEDPNFYEGVDCHLSKGSASSRIKRIIGIWSAFILG